MGWFVGSSKRRLPGVERDGSFEETLAMGEEVLASAGSRPGSSTAKTRDAAKKRAALWKRQIKSFKLKDVGKKVDAVRFCAQDERFFREQPEVLPLLIGFLSRTKTPELVMETLAVMHTLLSPPATSENREIDTEVIHPEVYAEFMLDRSMSADSAWKAGEPFINLFSMNALAPEIRIKAIEVYDLLLRASVVLSASAGEATPTLLQFQSVGSPCSALLGCLGAENGELQFTALSCLRSLMRNPPNEGFLDKFEAEKGIARSLEFVAHSERRYHRPALDILESFSHFECGREHLKTNGSANVLRTAIQEAQEMIQKTATVVPVSGMEASPLSAKDAPLLCSNIGVLCQVFVRMTLAKEQVAVCKPVEEDQALFMDAIDAMIAILRYDVTSVLSPVPAPTESPRSTGGAAAVAAANAAAVNAAALVSLLPFSIERSVAVISSLGRLIEYSERCKAHAKTQGLLPVLLDCFKVKEADNLHQVADKLLHLCVRISDAPEAASEHPSQQCEAFSGEEELQLMHAKVNTRIDPQILCAVATGDVETNTAETSDPDAASPQTSGEKAPLVAVETVLSLLETSHESANKALIFRHVRWIAGLVDLPGNANALGERAVSLFLQILASTSTDEKLLFAFLAKCIHAIVLETPGALELCGVGGHEPSTLFLDFLQETSSRAAEVAEAAAVDATDSTFLSQPGEEQPGEVQNAVEPVHNLCKLEWIDEYEEQPAFEPNPLTEACHNVDTFHFVAEALTGLAGAFLKWNPTINGAIPTDFSELLAAKLDAEHASPGKAAPAGSKKKLAPDQSKPSVVGESVMLCILEKGMQIPKLVSKFTAVNAAVCVSLLALLDNLMTVPSGMKVLLQLAKSEAQAEKPVDPVDSATVAASDEWPLSVELSSRTEHTRLLLPIMNVLQSPHTSFIEVEAAVRSLALMTSELEPSDKELVASAPEPIVEASKSPTKGGVAAPPPPSTPTVPELVVSESDRFINAALACGALVVLLAFTDLARIPRDVEDFSKRAGIMKKQIEEMMTKFIALAQVKQEAILTKYKEKLALLQPLDAEDAVVPEATTDLELPYQAKWAQLLLDRKFNVPRFGYESYSALLLAAELALPNLVSTLLNAGACSETESPDGVTPLMLAFLVGNEEMVIDLLDARANIDAITKDGQDLTVWNCALVSPLKARVSSMITQAYTSSESAGSPPTMSARIQLDSIEGSLQFLDMCLDAGVDVNVSNAKGDFLLHALLSKSIVRRKLRGLDLCFRYSSYYEDQRRLQQAVMDLIEAHSANVNSCNQLGQTPLHLALLYGYTGIAKMLLSHGANPNVQGVYGHLPLHYACLGFCGNLDGSDGQAIEVMRLLLEHAAKYTCTVGVHTDRRKHKTPAEKQALAIETILENGLQSVIEPQAIVQELATAQQVLTTPSSLGKFLPWHFACGAYVQLSSVLCLDDDMHKWFEANGQARADLLQYLLREWKIDISASASDGVTALHLAMKSDVDGNNLPVVDLLLESSSLNVNAVHEHILIDSLPVIPSGAQVSFFDDSHDVKQAFVSSRSIVSQYHIILADGQHVDRVQRSQLQVTYDPEKRGTHHSHYYKYLLPIEARFSALHYALQSNHDTLALRLLARPDISLDPEGSDLPLLALACAARQTPEIVGRLVTQQANMRVHLPLRTSKCDLTDVDVDTSSSIANRKHAAALHYAVMYEDAAMVEVLLTSRGGHVHPNVRRSRDGFTPLHLACQMEGMRIIKLLIQHGAKLTQPSSMSANGVSPLQLLIKFDSLENDRLKELIAENYLRAEMLLDGCIEEEVNVKSENQTGESEPNGDDEYDAPSCALLLEEEYNLGVYERLQGLNRERRGSHEGFSRRLESKLDKSDAVLNLFFDLIKSQHKGNDPVELLTEADPITPLMETFQQLRHRHECYRNYTTRSQWKPKAKLPRAVSKVALDEAVAEPIT